MAFLDHAIRCELLTRMWQADRLQGSRIEGDANIKFLGSLNVASRGYLRLALHRSATTSRSLLLTRFCRLRSWTEIHTTPSFPGCKQSSSRLAKNKVLRKKAGFSQDGLRITVGYTRTQMAFGSAGKRNPSLGHGKQPDGLDISPVTY